MYYHFRNGRYKCSECGMKFAKKWILQSHMSVHTKGRPYSCSVCHKCYKHKSYLALHLSSRECSVCDKCFKSKSKLIQHLRGKHCMCPVCREAFPDKIKLNEHLRSHEEPPAERPSALSCPQCEKEFTSSTGLAQHQRIHTLCEEEFKLDTDLSDHLKSHVEDGTMKPFSCSQCGKEYRRKCDLNRHMFVHSEEKPFSCSVCDKGFSSKYDLNRHLRRVHCTCPVCKEEFTRNADLMNHLTTHDEKSEDARVRPPRRETFQLFVVNYLVRFKKVLTNLSEIFPLFSLNQSHCLKSPSEEHPCRGLFGHFTFGSIQTTNSQISEDRSDCAGAGLCSVRHCVTQKELIFSE
uniref:C2H2-type domain-containing protein n=1 Tax=Periophthalmus magnuspinnatus TaxID=409849 RepID=A0A3B4AD56_9GOBI